MPRRPHREEDHSYDNEYDTSDIKRRKDTPVEQEKTWDRESYYDRVQDYEDLR